MSSVFPEHYKDSRLIFPAESAGWWGGVIYYSCSRSNGPGAITTTQNNGPRLKCLYSTAHVQTHLPVIPLSCDTWSLHSWLLSSSRLADEIIATEVTSTRPLQLINIHVSCCFISLVITFSRPSSSSSLSLRSICFRLRAM